jgi:hypothetical protein
MFEKVKKFTAFVCTLLLLGTLVASNPSEGQNLAPGGGTSFSYLSEGGAANADIVSIVATIPITAAGQTTSALGMTLTNTNHTGGNVYGMSISGITADAQANEYAINIGDGWDRELNFVGDGDMYVGDNDSFNFGRDDGTILLQLNTNNNSPNLQVRGIVGRAAAIAVLEIDLNTWTAMNGDDSTSFLFIDVDTVDHTGSNNFAYGLNIDGITADADAIEYAINIGDGWDMPVAIQDDSFNIGFGATSHAWNMQWTDRTSAVAWMQVYGETHPTGGTRPSVLLNAALGPANRMTMFELRPRAGLAMNGSDTMRGMFIDITDTINHTGVSNFLYGLDIDGITGDADATETAINIGDGWDYALTIPDGGAADNSISLGDTPGADADIYWVGQTLTFDTDATASNSVNFAMNSGGTLRLTGSGGTGTVTFDMLNVANTGYSLFELDVIAINATNGSDIVNMVFLDWNETDWATATEEWNAINIDDITQDAQGLYYGVHIGTGVDAAVYSEGVAHANLAAVANGSWVFCTNCDPASTPCTTGGASSGAFAFRVAGAWDCPW